MSDATERVREYLHRVEDDRTAIPFTDAQAKPYRLLSAALDYIEALERPIYRCVNCDDFIERDAEAQCKFEEAICGNE